MADVIDLASRAALNEEYDARLEATLNRLKVAGDALMDDLVNLAILGPWREWNEEQQLGAVAYIGTKALAQTSDPRISVLAQLLDHAGSVLHELQRPDKEEA